MRPVDQERLLRSGIRVSAISAASTLVASTVGVVIGVAQDSLALVAFGAVGLLDVAGSVTLVVHFIHARVHGQLSDRFERFALRVVTLGLVAVGIAIGGASLIALLERRPVRESVGGVVLAAASLAVLSVLSFRKRHVAVRIPSAALLADSRLSTVGAVLAGVTLGGTVGTRTLGWWWADPAAAFAIAFVAGRLGVLMRREPSVDS